MVTSISQRLWNVVINRLLFSVLLMQLLMVLTIGLQYRFRSLQWLSTIPPLLFILAFKIYINRVHLPAFQYFIPTENEIRLARVHSERADARGNRLGKRFGHPALHTDLFTPMLHAKMMPLLSQVYQGKIGRDEAKLNEYGGQKLEAQVVPGGIKIAAISQNDLEYDPALYQRDRGELDWDARSMASTVMFEGPESAKSPYQHGSSPSVSKPAGYDRYLAGGIQHQHQHQHQQSDIELSKIDSMQEPLLSPHSFDQQQQPFASQQSLSLSIPLVMYQDPVGNNREAPTHRPQERSYSPYYPLEATPAYFSPTYSPARSPEPQYQPYQQVPVHSPTQQYPPAQQPSPYAQQSRQSSNTNMAGRGAYRG